MKKQLSEVWRSLPQWLIPDWISPQVVDEEAEHLAALPAGMTQELERQLRLLPPPLPYRQAIQRSTRQALQDWQANPETVSNCLAVLACPVESIALILKESLQDYLQDCDVHFLLGGYHRPPQALDIAGHLQRELVPEQKEDAAEPAAPVTQDDLQDVRLQINVIPSLEPCFLRCIQGWEGIEYVQNLAAQDTVHFWVFGCNHWAWTFLDKVCQVSAYLEKTEALPQLSGSDLSKWLHPMTSTAIERADEEPLRLEITADDEAYWDALASLAEGNATTAAYLWLQTLRIETEQLSSDGTLPAETHQVDIVTRKPTLPSLMSLEVLDRYLLHALLVHREMTRSQLALSMGENERVIRSRVQVLQREGLIRQTGRWLRVHPAHYPKLYSELGNNNFLIGQA